MAQIVQNQPAMLKTQVQSLGQDNTLEKGMAILSSILAWRIPWTEEPGRLQFFGMQSDTTEQLTPAKRWRGKGNTRVRPG